MTYAPVADLVERPEGPEPSIILGKKKGNTEPKEEKPAGQAKQNHTSLHNSR